MLFVLIVMTDQLSWSWVWERFQSQNTKPNFPKCSVCKEMENCTSHPLSLSSELARGGGEPGDSFSHLVLERPSTHSLHSSVALVGSHSPCGLGAVTLCVTRLNPKGDHGTAHGEEKVCIDNNSLALNVHYWSRARVYVLCNPQVCRVWSIVSTEILQVRQAWLGCHLWPQKATAHIGKEIYFSRFHKSKAIDSCPGASMSLSSGIIYITLVMFHLIQLFYWWCLYLGIRETVWSLKGQRTMIKKLMNKFTITLNIFTRFTRS